MKFNNKTISKRTWFSFYTVLLFVGIFSSSYTHANDLCTLETWSQNGTIHYARYSCPPSACDTDSSTWEIYGYPAVIGAATGVVTSGIFTLLGSCSTVSCWKRIGNITLYPFKITGNIGISLILNSWGWIHERWIDWRAKQNVSNQ